MAKSGQRKCLCCEEFFFSNPRSRDRQRYCARTNCRLSSKAGSQAAWLAKPQNVDYFRGPGHVQRVQAWRLAHPGYSADKPGKRVGSLALQDDWIAQVADFIEETPKRTEMPEPAGDVALQDLLNATTPVLAGLIAHLFDGTLQEDIASTTRRLVQMGLDLIDRSHRSVWPYCAQNLDERGNYRGARPKPLKKRPSCLFFKQLRKCVASCLLKSDRLLDPQLTVRPQSHQAKRCSIWLLINQHQIRFDVAIPAIFPFTGQSMVTNPWLQHHVIGQVFDYGKQFIIQSESVLASSLALVVAFELARPVNLPHAMRPSDQQCS
jgi:hypothetical protein